MNLNFVCSIKQIFISRENNHKTQALPDIKLYDKTPINKPCLATPWIYSLTEQIWCLRADSKP